MSKGITYQDVKDWKAVLDNQNFPAGSYIDELYLTVLGDLERSKNDLIKKALIDKGFPEYATFYLRTFG